MVENSETKVAIADNLRRLLTERKWSQGELARRIFGQVDTSVRMMVSRWVNGVVEPSATDLLNLAEAFDVTPEEIARKKKSKKTG